MTTHSYQKALLRAHLLAHRRQLTPQVIARAGAAIVPRVLAAIDWTSVKTVYMYRANPRLQEVPTAELLTALTANYPALHISIAPFRPHAAVPRQLFDVVIVPVVGFDPRLHRLGMGGGWYDRFLAAQPQAYTLGVAYDSTWVAVVPTEPHDIPLKCIVTQTHCYMPAAP